MESHVGNITGHVNRTPKDASIGVIVSVAMAILGDGNGENAQWLQPPMYQNPAIFSWVCSSAALRRPARCQPTRTCSTPSLAALIVRHAAMEYFYQARARRLSCVREALFAPFCERKTRYSNRDSA